MTLAERAVAFYRSQRGLCRVLVIAMVLLFGLAMTWTVFGLLVLLVTAAGSG